MAYYCSDCTYRGQQTGPGGRCPACGSAALRAGRRSEESKPPGKLRLYLLVGLWAYLVCHILWKLYL
jgi:DNA-directed RNA polymerase subunit RPC12/RpoP